MRFGPGEPRHAGVVETAQQSFLPHQLRRPCFDLPKSFPYSLAQLLNLLEHLFRIPAMGVVVDHDVGAFTRCFHGNFGPESDAASSNEYNAVLEFHKSLFELK